MIRVPVYDDGTTGLGETVKAFITKPGEPKKKPVVKKKAVKKQEVLIGFTDSAEETI